MAFDSNSETLLSTLSTGTFLCGEMARNQSGRLSGSMWRNSKSVAFSRSTIAARCTHGQVLKRTSRYFAISVSEIEHDPEKLQTFQKKIMRPNKFRAVSRASA